MRGAGVKFCLGHNQGIAFLARADVASGSIRRVNRDREGHHEAVEKLAGSPSVSIARIQLKLTIYCARLCEYLQTDSRGEPINYFPAESVREGCGLPLLALDRRQSERASK